MARALWFLCVIALTACGGFQPVKFTPDTDSIVDSELPADSDGKDDEGDKGKADGDRDTFDGEWADTDEAPDTDFGAPGPGDSGDSGDSGSLGDSGFGTPLPELCRNRCYFAGDGVCDDGGAGATFSICPLGSDCDDCGPRTLTASGGLCSDTCPSAKNGVCEDGAPTPVALSADCAFGTDCTDCGSRNADMHCENTCVPDGFCDEDFGSCPLLTDCFDCGGREIP